MSTLLIILDPREIERAAEDPTQLGAVVNDAMLCADDEMVNAYIDHIQGMYEPGRWHFVIQDVRTLSHDGVV